MSPLRPQVVIAGCRAFSGADATDLYPDADWPFLSGAFREAGADASSISWDGEGVDWERFDLVVIRSTWDSVDRPEEFLRWARGTAGVTALLNPLAAIEWNIEKTYLRRLQSRGIPTAPTTWIAQADGWTPPPHEIVVKPSISAGGRQTARYQPDDGAAAAAHVRRLVDGGHTVMVQPYIASVDTDGEAKLVFIEGEFTHAVRVGALLDAGEGVIERPWEKVVPMTPMVPTSAQLGLAHDVLAAVQADVSLPLLYARVDVLTSSTGQLLLGEIELIDPSLLLRFVPSAATRLAEAITARAGKASRARRTDGG
jgi:hypothetical protein